MDEEGNTDMRGTKAELVMQELEKRGYECQVQTAVKNGVSKDGIIINGGESRVKPIYYPSAYSGDITEICDQIIETHKKNESCKLEFDINKFTEWEQVKDTLKARIRHKCDDGAVTRDFIDLEIYITSCIGKFNNGLGRIIVKKEHLGLWGISKDELFDTALKNEDEYLTTNIIDTLKGMGAEGLEFDTDLELYVMTNKDNCFGSSVMLYPECFAVLAEQLDSDLFILPSSVHEVLAMKAEGSAKEIGEIVREINLTQIAPEEILCDSVYRYSRSTGEITRA